MKYLRIVNPDQHPLLLRSIPFDFIRIRCLSSTPEPATPRPSQPLKPSPTSRTPVVPQILGYSGALPFLALSLCSPFYVPAHQLLHSYALSILPFLGAVHWGVALSSTIGPVTSRRIHDVDYIYSVLPALISAAAGVVEPVMSWSILAGGFGISYVWDMVRWGGFGKLTMQKRVDYSGGGGSGVAVPRWYVKMRGPLSLAAIGGSLVGLAVALEERGEEGSTVGSLDKP